MLEGENTALYHDRGPFSFAGTKDSLYFPPFSVFSSSERGRNIEAGHLTPGIDFCSLLLPPPSPIFPDFRDSGKRKGRENRGRGRGLEIGALGLSLSSPILGRAAAKA